MEGNSLYVKLGSAALELAEKRPSQGRLVSGHDLGRAERTLVRVRSIEINHVLSAEGRRAAPAVGAERLKKK